MDRDDSVYLMHILDAIARIEEYLEGVQEADFYREHLVQDGVIRQLEIVGEAVKHLSVELKSKYPHVAWQDIARMRDKLIHGYFGVDLSTVWLTATRDVPVLKAEIVGMLRTLSSDGGPE